MAGIVWLASYPKSGNTWLRAFLHNLLQDPSKPMDINNLDKFTHGDSLRSWYERVAGQSIGDWDQARISQLRPKVLQAISENWPDAVFVKTHNALALQDGIPLITLEHTAAAIYVLRDPRDVAVSMTHHFGLSLDEAIERLGDETAATQLTDILVKQFYGTWSTHVESWIKDAGQGVHLVRYEDMQSRPRATFGGIVQFLGLPPDRKRLDKAIRFASFKVLKAQERHAGFREKSEHADAFFRAGQMGQWRQRMSPEQIARIEADHGAVMRRYGYL